RIRVIGVIHATACLTRRQLARDRALQPRRGQIRRDRNDRLASLIDYFALALIHGLLVLMLLRLSSHPELDRESASPGEEQSDA
ncbi:MAG: hypothetical protein KJZ64_15755, partial [Sphingomonadaceae bacterium]|nr:hypothetical protein [Sphingomonadaceae bacterium]